VDLARFGLKSIDALSSCRLERATEKARPDTGLEGFRISIATEGMR
jgi:hypothetical protein